MSMLPGVDNPEAHCAGEWSHSFHGDGSLTQTARPTTWISSARHSWLSYAGLRDPSKSLDGSDCGTCSIRLATSPMPSQMTKKPGGNRHLEAHVDEDAVAA